VTNIGEDAFYDCKNLKTVYCYATKLPEIRVFAFDSYYDNQINYATATLYVPASAINEYKATTPWSLFGTILPIEDATTQIDAASTNDYNIVANGSNIIVKSDADGEKVSIYTFSGQLIGTTAIRNGSALINTNLKSGSVAIVMIGQNTYKIRLD
jgi:streptogramin lyase